MSRRAIFLALTLASAGLSIAAPPAWWSSSGATDTNPPNDDAAVNQGQLKHFTQKAVQELNTRIPGGAGTDLNGLVNGWVQAYQAGGDNASNPLPADFQAMNSGQLKWIANKIHARLVFAKYEDAVPAWLARNPASDNQLVNLGQLKTVFNFDLTAPSGQLPTWWQKFYFNGQTGINPNGDADGDGLTNAQELALGSAPYTPDTNGDGISDAEEYSAAEVIPPLIWLHRFVNASKTKSSAFRQFTPSVPPVPPTPIIGYYLKKTVTFLEETHTSHPTHYKFGTTDITALDSTTFLAAPHFPTIDFDINTLPGYYPNFSNGVWQRLSEIVLHPITKETDDYSSFGTYQLPITGYTGSSYYSYITTLSDEYTTAMLMQAGDTAFEGKIQQEEVKPWRFGFPPIVLSTYTRKDETWYNRTEVDYALEPPHSPEAPVRVAWLDVDRTDLGRGEGGTPDPAATQAITLHQEYYSKERHWEFIQTPSQASTPRTEIRRLTADLNKQRLILPLSCALDANLNLGSLIVSNDANNNPLPVDWEEPGTGSLYVNFQHNSWSNDVQYGDIVTDEFDVPVKLEAVEGAENIRLAQIITTPAGSSFLPVSLPIADVRNYTDGFIVQAISPGKVVLKASLTTKHGLQVSKRTQVENSLPPVSLVVVRNGIGSMVPSVRQGSPDHFVTPKKSTELPADKVIIQAYSPGMTPEFFREFYDWDTIHGSPDTNDPMKFEIDRTSPKKASVKIFDRKTGGDLAKMYVWVVWADGSMIQIGKTSFVSNPYDKTNGGTPTTSAMFISVPPPYWKFSFTIQPASIITEVNSGQDAPALSGSLPLGTFIPGGNGDHPILGSTVNGAAQSGGQFKYGASHYWDVSRQMEVTVINPGLIPWGDFSEGLHDLYSTQQPTPQATSIPVPFPTDPVMGNDDVGFPNAVATDERNDPYMPSPDVNLGHVIGEITSIDGPSSQIPTVAGVQGREYEELTHFREFARLKLPGGWFRVSDPIDWRFEMRVKFNGGHWQDNGCFPAPTP